MMALNYNPLADATYDSLRYAFIKQFEESGTVSLTAYVDTKGIATIGLGFNLRTHFDLILGAMGITDPDSAVESKYVARLRQIVDATHPDTGAGEQQLRAALDDVMLDRANDPNVPGAKRQTFAFDDETQVKGIFSTIADEIYEAKITAWEAKYGLSATPISMERLALYSLAYNTKDGTRSLLGRGLASAIAAGDRAEAWFEIRYNSNASSEGGVAKRRYAEAALFGLYDEDGLNTREEATQIFRMLQLHRAAIATYELKFENRIAAANTDLAAAGVEFDAIRPAVLAAELESARATFTTALSSEYSFAAGFLNGIAALNIYLDPGRALAPKGQSLRPADPNHAMTLDSRRFVTPTIEEATNDLLIGEGGKDILIAGLGDDVLIGGTGDDTLNGGYGNDVYLFRGADSPLTGDGEDIIRDADGIGSIRVSGVLLSGLEARSYIHPVFAGRPAWSWTVDGKTFNFVLIDGDLESGGTLWIEGEAIGLGSRIVVQNFSQGDLGLFFPANPLLQLLPEYPGILGPFADANYVPTTLSTTLLEGQARTVTLALNGPAQAGQTVRLSLGALSEALLLVVGSQTFVFVDGHVDLTLTAGQTQLTFSLLSRGDINDDVVTSLSAVFLDQDGNPLGTGSTLSIAVHGFDEGTDPITTNTIDAHDPNSVQGPRGTYPADLYGTAQNDLVLTRSAIAPGSSRIVVDEQGGNDDMRGGDGADQLVGGVGNDVLSGGGYIDLLHGDLPDGSGNGDDVLVGGNDSDLLMGDTGNDQLWAGNRGNQATAIADAEAQGSLAMRGDFLIGGDGNDFMVGSSGFDVLAGGNGQDVLVGGGGDDLLVGDLSYNFYYSIPVPMADVGDFDWGWSIVRGQSTQPDGSVRYTFTLANSSPYTSITAIPADAMAGAADRIHGGAGNDGIFAGYGDDFADGGAGDDAVLGGVGNDTLLGGAGVDMLVGGDAEDVAGKDFIDGGADSDTIFGGHAADALYGGAGNDYIYGDDADDALAGDDYISGGDGNDLIAGGAGADALYGGADDDSMYGDFSDTDADRQGNDFMDGGAGNDVLVGEGGSDSLFGGTGNDHLFGESSETPESAQQADFLDGGEGNDVLVGSGGGDTLLGGEGDDQLSGDASYTPVALHGDDYMDGGAGEDTLEGHGGRDTLLGGAGRDEISGGDGDDYLDGGEGNDELYGGAGNDVLRGGAGADVLLGGAGDDIYIFDADDLAVSDGFADGVIDSGGVNQLVFQGGFTLDNVSISSGADAGTLTLSAGSLGLIVQNALTGSIDSFAFADGSIVSAFELIGSRYYGNVNLSSDLDNATLIGGRISDNLVALGNNATLSGGFGDDLLTGGAGSTTYHYDRGYGRDTIDDLSTFAQTGNVNTLVFGEDVDLEDLTLSFVPGSSQLVIAFGGGDEIVLSDFSSGDVLNGPRTIDRFSFEDGTTLDWAQLVAARGITITNPNNLGAFSGTSANDVLLGSSASEVIDGGSGDDIIEGGGGSDTLSGGAGNDTYLFGSGSGTDTIDNADPSAAAIDRLEITGGLLPQDVQFFRVGDSLILLAGQDQLTIVSYFSTAAVDEIRFIDGTVYTPADVPLSAGGTQPTQGNDFLLGTANDDVIDGLGGIDIIHGFDGNDELRASSGGGSLYGEAGNDTLHGGLDEDSLYGGTGADVLSGGENADTLFGEADNDVLDGGYGNDTLSGGTGEDELLGGAGTDTLSGGDDDDELNGGAGNDSLSGGGGADTLTDLEGVNQLLGDAGDDILTGSGTLEGGVGDDRLTASGGRDVLRGGDGNDILHGGAGGDEVRGGAGNDELHSGMGEEVDPYNQYRDKVYGEDGDDILHAESAALLDGGAGNDTYIVSRSTIGQQLSSVSIVNDASSTARDVLQFGPGIASSDISVVVDRSGATTFYLRDSTNGDWVNVAGASLGSGIDEVRFMDEPQTVWSSADLWARLGIGRDVSEQIFYIPVARGNGGDDQLFCTDGDDDLDGGAGRDILNGRGGNDLYRFGAGSGYDELYDFAGTDRIQLGAGVRPSDVTLVRTSTVRQLYSNSPTPADALAIVLGDGQDQLLILNYYDASADGVIEEIRFEDGTVWDAAAIAARVVNQSGTANVVTGTAGDDAFVVDHASDQISEAVNGGVDQVHSSVSYVLPFNVENLTLTGSLAVNGTGNGSNNIIAGNAAQNVLATGGGVDTLIGGLGDDIYRIGNSFASTVIENANEGYDTIEMLVPNATVAVLAGNVERLVCRAYYDDSISTAHVVGNALDNVIDAAFQGINDQDFTVTIDGGAGADLLIGAQGTQIYIVDNVGDVVRELEGQPGDVIRSSVSYALPTRVHRLVLTGSDAITGTGGASNDVLDGSQNSAANTLIGAEGNDTYVVGVNDVIVEGTGGGMDTVEVQFDYTLGDNLEDVLVIGEGTAVITGNGGNNAFRRSGGATATFIGGAGDDTYYLGTLPGMSIVENADEGIDTVVAQGNSYVLGANIENAAVLSGGGTLTGNSLDNTLTVTVDSSTLLGGVGDDVLNFRISGNTLRGGSGSDTYRITGWSYTSSVIQDTDSGQLQDSGIDVVEFLDDPSMPDRSEVIFGRAANQLDLEAYTADSQARLRLVNFFASGAAQDRIELFRFADGTTLSAESIIASLTIKGTEGADTLNAAASGSDLLGLGGADTLNGGAGHDVLDGGAGGDTMNGGAGNDVYRVDDFGDTISEAVNSGVDTVEASVTHALVDNVENLTLLGAANLDGTGNALNNVLRGNAGVNVLSGGLGDDTYWVDNAGDQIIEAADAGADTVSSSVSWTLGANVEDLVLSGTAHLAGTGNDVNNRLTGNSGNNVLDGGLGADELRGGAGNDVYYVNEAGDTVFENAGAGVDEVRSTISYTLTSTSNLENVTLLGDTALSATGNSLDNVLIGNSAANQLTGGSGQDTLDGGAANDAMSGGQGNDVYYVDDALDTTTESSGQGTDTVRATLSWVLATNLENLELLGSGNLSGTGNSSVNRITGNAGDNTLNGLGGADALIGGAGNDTYVVDNAGDVVTELANEGIDLVQSTVTYTLSSQVENLTLGTSTSTSNINGFGNALDNVLTGTGGANRLEGGEGNDTLDGLGGNDTMLGGQGNDTYVVAQTGDVVTESANQGADTVRASVSYTLSAEVENLVLTSEAAINGSGNALANVITGNAGNNTLTGLAGDDMLIGANGADIYSYSTGHGADTIDNSSGDTAQDRLNFTNMTRSQVSFTRSSNDLLISRNGSTTDSVRVSNWFAAAGNQLDFVQFTDQTLTSAQINALFGTAALSSIAAPEGPVVMGDEWDRSLLQFVDAINHFGGQQALVVDRVESARHDLWPEWLLAGATEHGHRRHQGIERSSSLIGA